MGFEFGVINEIPVITGTECFIATILLLLVFEYILGGVDLLKDVFPTAYLMFQKIFKELMIMGIVSFTVVMFETSRIFKSEEILLAVDVAHILLFFMALFYVVNAILLIQLCALSAAKNRKFYRLSLENVLSKMYLSRGLFENFLFQWSIIPGLERREMIEFKVYEIFFKKTYSLAENFAFADYLIGCNQKRCIRLLDMGVFTWVIIIILSLLNYARVRISTQIGVKCAGPRTPLEIDIPCAQEDLKDFIAVGILTSIIAFSLLIASRVYDLR